LENLVVAKRKKNEYFNESDILHFSSQLLSAIDFLHSKEYIHAPGMINSKHVFFTETYNKILLDIGKNASTATAEWLLQNSKDIATNRKYIEYIS
jgi:hypothetical protein